MSREALRHLRRDPAFDALIRRVGRCGLTVQRAGTPYEALMRAIAHQQLHAPRGARRCWPASPRFFPAIRLPATPRTCWRRPRRALRGLRLLRPARSAALRDICAHALSGTVPTAARCRCGCPTTALIERLTAIRGVGRWTVEMLLIFTLGRPDVLPVDDFGVREGYRVAARAGGAAQAARAGGDRRGVVAAPLGRRLVSVARRRRRQAGRGQPASAQAPPPARAMTDEGALVLFCGGQDSATCLAWALDRFARVETIGFDYGQRHRSRAGLPRSVP